MNILPPYGDSWCRESRAVLHLVHGDDDEHVDDKANVKADEAGQGAEEVHDAMATVEGGLENDLDDIPEMKEIPEVEELIEDELSDDNVECAIVEGGLEHDLVDLPEMVEAPAGEGGDDVWERGVPQDELPLWAVL